MVWDDYRTRAATTLSIGALTGPMLSSRHLARANAPMTPVLLSAGKTLTDPLLVGLVVSIASLTVAWRQATRKMALSVALAANLLLAIFSTGLTRRFIESTLLFDDGLVADPQVIVIAGGGSEPDELSSVTQQRVRRGVACWRRHPTARLVMAGADTLPHGYSSRTASLMRLEALGLGVPAAVISLDLASRDTSEHPRGLLRLGFRPSTRVAVVTSEWHMRRTVREFRRYFSNVSRCEHPQKRNDEMTINHLLPGSANLRQSTLLLQEWLGIAWYALRG